MLKSRLPVIKCSGIWWQYNFSASCAVQENISKTRKAFIAFDNIDAFHGSLNPLSGRGIFETCIIPLYGCETWLLDATTIKMLESFQSEIGHRIFHLPKYHSNMVVRLGLHWPSVATRILICKLAFLPKLLANTDDIIKELSHQVFENFSCHSWGTSLSPYSPWFDHICTNHPDVVNNLSCEEIISGLRDVDASIIFSVANSKLNLALMLCISTLFPLH